MLVVLGMLGRLLMGWGRLVLLGRGSDGTDYGGGRDGGGWNLVRGHWAGAAAIAGWGLLLGWRWLLQRLTRGRRWSVALDGLGCWRGRRCGVAGSAGRGRRVGVRLVAILLLLLLLLLALAVVLPLLLQLLPDQRILHNRLRVELQLARRRNPLGHPVGQRRQSHLLLRVMLEQQVRAVGCGSCRGGRRTRWQSSGCGALRQDGNAARARAGLDEDVGGDYARAGV